MAWGPLGWEDVAFSEIEPFPCRLLAERYPDVPNLGDMTRVDWNLYRGRADVLIGGTPCQSFSVAGLRGSLSDDRGNLALEFINAANAIRPRFAVWENVPGVLSTKDNAFGCFLGGLVGANKPLLPASRRGRWPSAGVVVGPERSAAWRVLDAQYFGLAQRRKRVFVVASSGDGTDPFKVLFEPEGVQRDSPPSREEGELDIAYSVTSKWAKGYGGPSGDECYNMTVSPAWVPCKDCDEFVCLIHNAHVFECDCKPIDEWFSDPYFNGRIRKYTPMEVERIMGFPDNYTFVSNSKDTPRYKALGNSMAVPVIRWIGQRVSARFKTTLVNLA